MATPSSKGDIFDQVGDIFDKITPVYQKLPPQLQMNRALNASPTQFEIERNPSFQQGWAPAFLNSLKNLIPSGGAGAYYQSATPADPMAKQVLDNQNQQLEQGSTINQDAARKAAGYGPLYRAVTAAASVSPYPINTQDMERGADIGNNAQIIGAAAGSAAPAILAPAIQDALSRPSTPTGQLAKAKAIQEIANRVNPSPSEIDVPKFKQDLTNHLDSIVDYAKRNNLPLNSASDFAKAASGTGAEARAQYQQLLSPVANDTVAVPRNAQFGRVLGEYNRTASLGEIDSRLSEINNTLYPKYQKGGVAASAAVGSQEASNLRSEFSQLRSILADELSKRTGTPSDAIAALRERMGATRQLGEDIQYYSDRTQKSINDLRNNPIHGEARVPAYAAQRAQIAYRDRFGTPSDKGIKKALMNYSPKP